jgi:hypothetical protein
LPDSIGNLKSLKIKKLPESFSKILDDIFGIWEDHSLFRDKNPREVFNLMRGPDDDTKQ